MHRFNTFLLVGLFATFAYVWVYIVVVQISPGYIDIGEAVFTLLFFPLLLFGGYAVEKCNPVVRNYDSELEYNRRLMCKQYIQNAARQHGTFYVLDLVTGSADPLADTKEATLLREHYKIYLGVDDLKTVSIDELLDAIDATCPVSRLKHRRGASNLNSLSDKPFVKIH
jgi:hypothetical protein